MSGSAPPPQPAVAALTVLAGLVMLIPGSWGWLDPASFAEATNWPNHVHFLHDAGVFQIAIGLMLLFDVLLGVFSVLAAVALLLRVRQLRRSRADHQAPR